MAGPGDPPGETLLEEFLKPLGIGQTVAARSAEALHSASSCETLKISISAA